MRLIDADALKNDFPKDEDWEYPVNTNEYVCECIDAQPAVDPVRHGKWIYRDDDFDFYDTYTCSECDGEITVDSERHYDMGMVIEDVLYCPHCGSRNVVETWSVPMLKPREELR